MPEVYLKIEWPDQEKDRIYSPSTVINQYFRAGDNLTLTEFEAKVEAALNAASQRVYEKFGFECMSAMGELDRVRNIIDKIADKNGIVKIL